MKLQQVCEICLAEPSYWLSHNLDADLWRFTCVKCGGDYPWFYSVEFSQFFDELNWEDHIRRKGWNMEEFLPRFWYATKNLRYVRKRP